MTTLVDLKQIKNQFVFSNKHDRNILFPTEGQSSSNNVNNRSIIFHGALTKLGTESFFARQNRRYCFLLADMLIITKEERQERYQVRQVVSLQNATISDLFFDSNDEKDDDKVEHVHNHDFRLNAPDYGRDFVFRTNSWNKKHSWVLQLRKAISNLQAYSPNQAYGWHHKFSTDTIFFHSINGNLKSLKKLQQHLILYNNSHGSKMNSTDGGTNKTPVSSGWAKVKAHVHQLHELLSVDEDGASILHYASAYGHYDIVQYLLGLNVFDIHSTDHNLFSPLHCAAYYGHPQVLDLLLKNGADHAARDLEDKTPLYMCIDSSIYSKYQDKNRQLEKNYHTEDVVQTVIKCIEILAKYNCDLDVCDSTGDSVLIHASKGQNVEIVETLLKLGAGPLYKRELDGKNALHVACEANSQRLSIPIIEVLIKYGKTEIVNSVTDDNIETPLMTLLNGSACLSGSTIGAAAIKLLEKNGAYVTEEAVALSGGILSEVILPESNDKKDNAPNDDKRNDKQKNQKVNGDHRKLKIPVPKNDVVDAIPILPSTKLNVVPPKLEVDSPHAFA